MDARWWHAKDIPRKKLQEQLREYMGCRKRMTETESKVFGVLHADFNSDDWPPFGDVRSLYPIY